VRSKTLFCGRSPAEIVGSIPTGAWIFVCCECCVLSGRGLCDVLITRPMESYRLWCVVGCDLETSWMRRPWPTGSCCAKNEQNKTKIPRSFGTWGRGTRSHHVRCSKLQQLRVNYGIISDSACTVCWQPAFTRAVVKFLLQGNAASLPNVLPSVRHS